MQLKGIDVSEWNGNLKLSNWQKIKSDGVEFAILRIGVTGYGKSKTKNKDSEFENNYAMCKQIGLPIGVYYYSCAVTEEEAKVEANKVIDWLKDKKIDYPIFFDTEDNHDITKYSNESQASIGKTRLTKVTKAFCETIKEAGYTVGIYASLDWFANKLNDNELKKYEHWIAQWANKCNYNGEYGMWQYSSTGKVNGLNGSIDMNYCYKDYLSREEVRDNVSQTKSVDELAKEVIDGKWDVGNKRYELLTNAGYNYDEVQNKVNEILSHKKPTLKCIETVAREVIQGKWGNGQDRYNRLTKAGYNYNEVQSMVNKILKSA